MAVVSTIGEGSPGTLCGTHTILQKKAKQSTFATEILHISLLAAEVRPTSATTNDSTSLLSGSHLSSNFCESKPRQEPQRTTRNSEQQTVQQEPCHH